MAEKALLRVANHFTSNRVKETEKNMTMSKKRQKADSPVGSLAI